MKLFVLTALVGLVSANAAVAGEHAASEEDIRKLVVGRTVSCGGAHCRYGADGTYTYNGQDPGQYTIAPGKICMKFLDGSNRCDHIVITDDGAYMMINSFGRRMSFVRPDLPANGSIAKPQGASGAKGSNPPGAASGSPSSTGFGQGALTPNIPGTGGDQGTAASGGAKASNPAAGGATPSRPGAKAPVGDGSNSQ